MEALLKVYVSGSIPIDYSFDNYGEFNNQFLRALQKSPFHISDLKDADILISINHSNSAYKSFMKFGKTKKQCVLIRIEPYAVFPAQYSKRITDKYSLIISVGYKEIDEGKYYYVGYPYSCLPNPNAQLTKGTSASQIIKSEEFEALFTLNNWLNRTILVSLIASNKVSSTTNNNYGLRRNLAYSFSKSALNIYGDLWDANFLKKLDHRLRVAIHAIRNRTFPNSFSVYGSFFRRYKNFIGKIENKQSFVKNSKFSLIVENSNDSVSEKLFDALINGSIPIYYGPQLKDVGIPGHLISLDGTKPTKYLEEKIANMPNDEIANYLKEIKKFLKSQFFLEYWTEENVYKKIIEKIQKFNQKNI
jgi:hypothetical protein